MPAPADMQAITPTRAATLRPSPGRILKTLASRFITKFLMTLLVMYSRF
jgi:hypothetical protein